MKRVDTLVIGAGIAGLSAAARLARHGSIAVCEGETALGFHASGRSAAFAHFGMDNELVRRLTAVSMPHMSEPMARTHPALFVARRGEEAELDALEDVHRRLANGHTRLTFDEARELVPILRADGEEAVIAALLDPNARKLDSDAMLQHNRRALKDAGGDLVLDARVERLARAGERWIVDTPAGSFEAGVIVNAAGAWVDQVAIMAGARPIGIAPKRRSVITFAAPEGVDVSPWPFTKTLGGFLYFEPEGRGRLLASPMDETPSEPCDAQPEEEDVATAAWRMEQLTTIEVRRIESKWAGLRSFAPDGMPVAGFDPAAPGFFWLAGQGGFGLQTSPAMALAAEALVTGSDWPEELRAFEIAPRDLSPARLGTTQ